MTIDIDYLGTIDTDKCELIGVAKPNENKTKLGLTNTNYYRFNHHTEGVIYLKVWTLVIGDETYHDGLVLPPSVAKKELLMG